MPSIGELNARVTANASQFVQELSRADNEARRRASSIDKELGQLTRNLERKFSLSNIGKDALKFLGLGSGFAVADMAFNQVAGIFRDAEEASKAAAESIAALNSEWSKLSRKVEESAISRMSPAAAIETRKRQLEEVTAKIATIQQRTAELNSDLALAGSAPFGTIAGTAFDPTQGKYGSWKSMKTVGDQITSEIDKLSRELVGVQEQRLELLQQISETQTKVAEKEKRDLLEVTKLEIERWGAMEQNALKALEAIPESAFESRRDAIENMFWAGRIGAEAADKAIAELDRDYSAFTERQKRDLQEVTRLEVERWGDMAKAAENAISRINDLGSRRDAIDDAFWGGKISAEQADKLIGDLDKVEMKSSELKRELAMMWNDVSRDAGRSFADILIDGENTFKKLPDILARAIAEMFARLAIINPVLNAIFGGFGGFGKLPTIFDKPAAPAGRASGGPVSAGGLYEINERGTPEVLSVGGSDYLMMGARGGRVTPSSGGGGNTYVFNLPGGVTQSVFEQFATVVQAALGPGVIERRAVAAVADRNMRIAY